MAPGKGRVNDLAKRDFQDGHTPTLPSRDGVACMMQRMKDWLRRVHPFQTPEALFPLLVLLMATLFVREARAGTERAEFAQTWAAMRAGLGERSVWLVAASSTS